VKSSGSPERSEDRTDVLGRRIAAALVDLGALFVLFLVLGFLIGDTESGDGGGSVYLEGAGFLVFVALSLLYYFLPEAATGQTLGKRLLGVRVATLEGNAAGPGPVAVRTVLRVIDTLPFLYLLGLIVVLLTPRRQRIGDLAARTVIEPVARSG
jgi:uncharacterized RDD family membrane protein YckC